MCQTSKFMSLILRHNPAKAGLTLDSGGWVSLVDLVSGMNAAGYRVSMSDLLNVVESSDKKRFTISEDKTRIRAAQGHSVSVDLSIDSRKPPDVLFHGTAGRNVLSILQNGIHSANRQYVHLSEDEDAALSVGQRHGRAVVLKIDAKTMFQNDVQFWLSENGIWLTKYVPIQYIKTQKME